jgi:hypothetical protein
VSQTAARHRWVVAALAVALLLVPAAHAAAKTAHCPAGQVKQTIGYHHTSGGSSDHATGCVVKTVTVPKSFVALQQKIRAFAFTLLPKGVIQRLRSKVARRVAAFDAKTDALIGAAVITGAPVAEPPPARRAASPRARSARLTESGNGGGETVSDGVSTTHLDSYETHDTFDRTGGSFSSTTTSTVLRAKGTSTKKKLVVKHLIDRCPDAGGRSQGELAMTQTYSYTTAGVSVTEVSTFNADVVAQFNDSAEMASAQVDGKWTFDVHTAHSDRSVGGDSSASGFRVTEGHASFGLDSSVTNGSDDAIVTGGKPIGTYVGEILAHQYIEDMLDAAQKWPQGGGCVNIVPNAPTVHVKAGGMVAIVAHLTDHHSETFSGPMTAINTSNRVAPTQTVADTDATFTYTAPADAKAGDTDAVRLTHVSKRGKALEPVVNVVVDATTVPQTFTGTWTTVIDLSPVTETIQGTATFQLDPLLPASYATFTSLTYDAVSASVDWKMQGPGCSDHGHSDAVSLTGSTRLTLQDVSTNPAAPQPEPQPFYYSVRATGDLDVPPPQADLSACGLGTESVDVYYLDVGYGSPFGPGAPVDKILKSANPALLAGHWAGVLQTNPYDETWSFSGTG